MTFYEFLDLIDAAPRVVGAYPEVKHPTWHNQLPQVRASRLRAACIVSRCMQIGAGEYAAHLAQPAAAGALPRQLLQYPAAALAPAPPPA